MTTPPTDRETTIAPATDPRFDVPVRGVTVDPETRCVHWDSPVDVVALRFGCCETYYPCDACPACGAAFNPGYRAHRDRYFGTGDDAK